MNKLTFSVLAVVVGNTLFSAAAQADRTWDYTYSTLGLIEIADGPRTDVSDITTYTYDGRGNISSITNALGQVTQLLDYNAYGKPGRIIDPNEVETLLTYHVRGWLMSVTIKDPSGNSALDAVSQYEYDVVGQLTHATFPNGNELFYEYDDARRLIAMADGLGNRIEYTLDNAGNRLREDIKDSSGVLRQTHTMAYDELSRLMDTTGAADQSTHLRYDVNDNLEATTDALNNGVNQGFDALNRLVSQVDADNGQISYTYDDQDRITSVTDQRGLVTRYSYNSVGDLIRIDSPDTGITLYEHDAAGNVIQKTDARGIVTHYTYDAINRLTHVSYPNSPEENITYQYDNTEDDNYGIGRLTDVIQEKADIHYHYNHLGFITRQQNVIDSHIYNTHYTYNLAGDLMQQTYPSGRIVAYQRDGQNRLVGITSQQQATASADTIISHVDYQAFGTIQGIDFGNGVTTHIEYDLDSRISAMDTAGADDIQQRMYQYDAVNNITEITQPTDSGSTQYFDYDNLYRLSQDTGSYGTKSYTYDAVGNRLLRETTKLNDKDEVVTKRQRFTYSEISNRIAKRGNKETLMDANGNTLSERNAKKAFIYNADNRLVQFKRDGVLTASYRYNPLGQRITKERLVKAGTRREHFFYDLSGQLIARHVFRPNGSTVWFDTLWLDNIPVARTKAPYRVDGSLKTNNVETLWLRTDHVNTPRVATDLNQTVVWRWQSDAFGVGKPDTDPDGDGKKQFINLRFPGQYKDGESGLHYNYYRDYDPSLGRYIQSDPIGLEGGLNTYAYVGGNPLMYSDSLGLAYSPQGEHGISREEAMALPPNQDPCSCFAKAFLGYAEAGVAATEAATGPYVNKPRGGIAGGGKAGGRTSAWSSAIHQVNKRAGKSAATAAARTAGRVASRAVPYAGTALLIYDITVFNECMEDCEEDECKQ